MADIRDLINAAYDEVRELPRAKYPSMLSVAVNHPGFIGHEVVDDAEYQNKYRYDQLMRRLDQIQRDNPREFADTAFYPKPVPHPTTGKLMMRPVYGRELKTGPQDVSPYRERGAMAQGMFLPNALQVLQSPFSVVANTARSTYDLDKAAEEAPYVANKSTGGLWNALQGKDPNQAWADERKWVGERGFDDPVRMMANGNPGLLYQPTQRERGSIEGPEFLKEDFGLPDNRATDMAGYVLEAAIDPVTGATQAVRHLGKGFRAAAPMAKAAHAARAASLLGQEVTLPATWTGLGVYNDLREGR